MKSAAPALTVPRPVRLLLALSLGLALGALALALALALRPAPPLPQLGTLPDFRFTRQDGRPFGLAELRGRPFVANFIFTRCPTVCPAFTRQLAQVQERTEDVGEGLQLVSFSVDPGHDTPERLADYARRHGAREARWSFLTGDPAQVQRTVVEGFRIALGREPSARGEDDVSGLFHGTHFVLVDGEGHIRGYYLSEDGDAVERLVRDARRLARERT